MFRCELQTKHIIVDLKPSIQTVCNTAWLYRCKYCAEYYGYAKTLVILFY